MKQTFTIKGRLPGYNEHEKRARANPYMAAREKTRRENVISRAIRAAKIQPIDGGRWINFEWHEKTKRRDKDNVAFAKKYILDALQKTKVLPNDNNKFLKGFTDSFVYDKTDRVIVTIISSK
jgi:Holliday junction resolvase RusA-like endonuclease